MTIDNEAFRSYTSLMRWDSAFSLIELMVVVAVIAILATIAIPGYQGYIQQSRRSEALTSLLTIQKGYELYYANNNTYVGAASTNITSTLCSTGSTNYDYTCSSTATTYNLSATAKSTSTQTIDTQGSTPCSTLSIDQLNNKTPQNCWNFL